MTESIRLAVVSGVFLCGLFGLSLTGYVGGAAGLALGAAALVLPWWRQPLWSWAILYAHRNRTIRFAEPMTVANDRSSGGVRFQDGITVTALALLGKPYQPTVFAGSIATQTANTIDVGELHGLMTQSLGLTIESISVICTGSRRGNAGDFPRVYDTLIGPSPYAGRRETWLIIRIRSLANGEALKCRDSAGIAALAATQRIAAALRCRGIRAKVASVTDIIELDRRLGTRCLEPANRRWRALRDDSGWRSTYAYRPADLNSAALAQSWSLPADTITQNLTIGSDGGVTATVTVHTAQPATVPPSVMLQTLPGRQTAAVVAGMCIPRPELRGLGEGRIQRGLILEVGSSGVLLGRSPGGDRVSLPLTDPGQHSRVHIAADDAIAKRIVARTAATGERITVHTADASRWDSVRMPNVAITDQPRPARGTTVSVVDGTVQAVPRPSTVISVSPADTARVPADVEIAQTAPGMIRVTAAGVSHVVEIEFFRAENRYASGRSVDLAAVAVD